MLQASWIPYSLRFRFAAGTSRGQLLEKPGWFLLIKDKSNPSITGIGEISLIPGLSPENEFDIPDILNQFCDNINQAERWLETNARHLPALRFGFETAMSDLNVAGTKIFVDNVFTRGEWGLPINGLVWMGDFSLMLERIESNISAGYNVIKLKIGAIGFEQELKLISDLRKRFSASEIEIRLDANGAFSPDEVLEKIHRLSEFEIHSIEQPIKPQQWDLMAELCYNSPVPIALDEELIGIHDFHKADLMLRKIRPAFIILKPSLLGGLAVSDKWISLASNLGIGWWATSALESNIGLNAIAQWVSSKDLQLHQGLGTGQLYYNNIPSPLRARDAQLFHMKEHPWELSQII